MTTIRSSSVVALLLAASASPAPAAISVGAPSRVPLGAPFSISLRSTVTTSVAAFSVRLDGGPAAEIVRAQPTRGEARLAFGPSFVGYYDAGAAGGAPRIVVWPRRAGRLVLRLDEIRLWDASGRLTDAAPSIDIAVQVGDRTGRLPRGLASTRSAEAVSLPPGIGAAGAQTFAEQGRTTLGAVQALATRPPRRLTAASGVPVTFVVTSAADGPDAVLGDDACIAIGGGCTLRAALTEANRHPGPDAIAFSLPTPGPDDPARIVVTSPLEVSDASGGVVIDGYSQPGAAPNSDLRLSNARIRVELRTWDAHPIAATLVVSTPGNVIRGLAFVNGARGIYLGHGADGNRIVGNWFGIDPQGCSGSAASPWGSGVEMNAVRANTIGSAALADRNVFGGRQFGVHANASSENVIQGNLIGIAPDGSICPVVGTGIDLNSGAKHNRIGGLGPGEGNVIAGGGRQAIEISHGANPLDPSDHSDAFAIVGNRIEGNQIGLRADGSFDEAFLSLGKGYVALSSGVFEADGINVYDASRETRIEGNRIMPRYAGISNGLADTNDTVIVRNRIGVTATGTTPHRYDLAVYQQFGVLRTQITGNTIGGADDGVVVRGYLTRGVTIRSNVFQAIRRMPIDLLAEADPDSHRHLRTANDEGDVDEGPNGLLNSPVITYATSRRVRGRACPFCTVQIYGRRGTTLRQVVRGTVVADAAGSFSAAVRMIRVTRVRAIAIEGGNTSEMSGSRRVRPAVRRR